MTVGTCLPQHQSIEGDRNIAPNTAMKSCYAQSMNFHHQGRSPRARSRGSRSPCVAARSRARGRSHDFCLGSSQLPCSSRIASVSLAPGQEIDEDDDTEVGLEFISSLLDDAVEDYTDEAVHEVVFACEAPVVYSVPEPTIAEGLAEEELSDVEVEDIAKCEDVADITEVQEVEREQDEDDHLEAMFHVFDVTAAELTKATIEEATESFCQSVVGALPIVSYGEEDEEAVTVYSDEEYVLDEAAAVAQQMAYEFVWEPPPELTPEVPETVDKIGFVQSPANSAPEMDVLHEEIILATHSLVKDTRTLLEEFAKQAGIGDEFGYEDAFAKQVSSTCASDTMPVPVNALTPCTRSSFSRTLRPPQLGAPVPEEPFPSDCLPPSTAVAPALAPRGEAFQFLMDVSASAPGTSMANRITPEAYELFCRALAMATLQELWLRAPWQQQVEARMAVLAAAAAAQVEATASSPAPSTAPVPPTAPPRSSRTAAPRRRMLAGPPISIQAAASDDPALVPVPPSSPPARPQTAQPTMTPMPPTSPTARPQSSQHGGRPRRSLVASTEFKTCPTTPVAPPPTPPSGRPGRTGARPNGMIVAPAAPNPASCESPPAPLEMPLEAPVAPAASPTPASSEPRAPAKPPVQPGGARRPCRPGVVITSDASHKGGIAFRLDIAEPATMALTAPERSSSLTNAYQTLGTEFHCLSEDDAGSSKARSPRQVLKSPRTPKTPRTAHMSPRPAEHQVPTALELDLGISSTPPDAKPLTPRDLLPSPRISKAAGTGLLPMLPTAGKSADSIAWSMGVGRVGASKVGWKGFH